MRRVRALIARRSAVALSASVLVVGSACGSACGVVHERRDASVQSEFCDAPAPGCPCVPAWWTGDVCYSGPPKTLGVGACRAGKQQCQNGIITPCAGEVTPVAEVCNGIDDDCNGLVDDVATPDAGDEGGVFAVPKYDASAQCMVTSAQGLCQYGRFACSDGGAACAPVFGPHGMPEDCNGIDDDCNGLIDDQLTNLGVCPLANKGECAKGASTCSNGNYYCVQKNKPIPEICNGLDDDCNGIVDDGVNMCPTYYYCAGKGGCQVYCPHVFAWTGDGYRYETTVGGASLVGKKEHLTHGREVEFSPLWVRLDAAQVDASGAVRAELLAADDEIVYFDRAELAVVAHPAGHEVFSTTSIQFNSGHPAEPEALIALPLASMRAPLRAAWMGRVEVDLARGDDRAARAELAMDNFYEIDFGEVRDPSRARLILDGWKFKTPRGLPASVPREPPRLEVLVADARGERWQKALTLATPRGDKKAVVFDLAPLARAWNGRYRMRVYTGTNEDGNAMWYLDRARLTEAPAADVSVRRVSASRADLEFVGAPTILDEDDHTHPLRSVDDGRGPLLPEQRTYGRFTRYGDVRSLLAASDDRLVIMRRGDAVRMTFPARDEVQGVKRDASTQTLFLITELLYKPRRWLSQGPIQDTVDPVPFHGMGVYPPRAPSPRAADEWQTRVYERGDPRWGK